MNKRSQRFTAIICALLVAGALAMTGCGGSGTSDSPAAATTTITGQVVDGAIADSKCNAYQVNSNGTKGTLAGGPATTDTNGNYTISMSYTGPVIVECADGSYTDWATGSPVTLTSADVMSAVVSNASGSVSVQVTPLTHMAASLALKDIASGTTAATAISNANNKIGTYFGGVDIINTSIINPTATNSATGVSQAAIDYSLVLAGISKYAQTNNITNPFTLVTALAMDASDGTLDGKEGTSPLQLFTTGGAGWMNLSTTSSTTEISAAITAFQGSTSNISGGTITNTIVTNLTTATGTLPQPIATIAVSPATATLTTAGAVTELVAVAKDANGTDVTPHPAFTWTSSNTDVATVSKGIINDALVTAIANGTATITASAVGIKGTSVVTVTIPGGNTTPAPTITSFTPTSGAVGATVTITGTNFGPAPAGSSVKYDVKFNGVQGDVQGVGSTEITVKVPTGATTGTISVTTAGGTATSSSSFTVTAAGTGTNAALVGTWAGAPTSGNISSVTTLTFNANGTFTWVTTVTGAVQGSCSFTGGTYTVSGSNIDFTSPTTATPSGYFTNGGCSTDNFSTTTSYPWSVTGTTLTFANNYYTKQ